MAHFGFVRRAPAFDSWRQIVASVSSLKADGDLVVVAPRWAEPLARHVLGDRTMPLADVARADTTRYRTALEISILDQRDPELASWRELSRNQRGKFTFRRLQNPQPKPVAFDFVAGLSPQRTEVFLSAWRRKCPYQTGARVKAGGLGGHPTFSANRFQCPGRNDFINVGVTVIADQDFRPRRCVWAHPPGRGQLVIQYRQVDLGKVIGGHGGMYWLIERKRQGAPIELAISVDGKTIGRAVHVDGDGWSPFEFALGDLSGAQDKTVQFAVSASNFRHRHFCFEAYTR